MNEVIVIITVWRRNYLEQQLKSLINQNTPPKEIWIIQNQQHINVEKIISNIEKVYPNFLIIKSSKNLKYFFRFSIGLLCTSEYILFIDDDIIPGTNWISICLQKSKQYNAIISCSGRIIPKGDLYPEIIKGSNFRECFIGDYYSDEGHNFCLQDTQVDFGCNSYFVKSSWIKYFWNLWPTTFESGEDIHLSATLMIQLSVRTIVPQQVNTFSSGNIIKDYGRDKFSSWKQKGFFEIRRCILSNLIFERGWLPVLWK